jgi:hypothetical protein
MTTNTRPVALTGAALVAAGALFVATPTITFDHELAAASAPSVTTVSSAFQLMSYSEWQGNGGASNHSHGSGVAAAWDDEEDDDDGEDVEDDGEDHHRGGGFGGFGNIGSFITNYLDNNQAQVLAVTAGIPVFNLGPVAVGNSLLANAYYSGYNGSAVGVPGVVSYVTSQLGTTPTNLLQGVVLGLTSLTPQINLGPVAIGNSLLATAYFSGYNGSATGLPGVISYVTSQLGIQAPAPASAVRASSVATPSVVSARAAASVDSSAAGTAQADAASAGRSAAGRLTAKTASAAGQAKAGAARAARSAASES